MGFRGGLAGGGRFGGMGRGRRAGRRPGRAGLRLGMERLEERVVLSTPTSTWSGHDAATNDKWSDNANWDVPPAPGNDLVFPAGLSGAALTSVDDISGGSFGALTIKDTGYTINGATGVTLGLSGSVDASQSTGSSIVNVPIDFGTNAATVTVDNTAGGLTLQGAIAGSGGLTKAGPGVLDLKGTNTYTGGTTANAGTLLVDGTVAGAVAVNSTATLGGTGTVASITSTSGTVSPGDSPTLTGILTDSGDLTLASGSSFDVAINGTSPGTSYDQLVAGSSGGTIDLTGATLNVTTGSFIPPITTPPTTFTILHNNTGKAITGTFANLAEGATLTADGHVFSISYKGGADQQDVVLTAESSPTLTWTGKDSTNTVPGKWSDSGNWGGVTPAAGDTLIFPTGLTGAALTSQDDITDPNVIFNSITIQDGGYAITGATGATLKLAGSIDASQSSGSSTLGMPITFNPGVGTTTVDNPGASLVLGGVVTAPNELTKLGLGTLTLGANDGSLGAVINAGTLLVDGTAGDVSANAGSTLGGTGTVATIATIHATLNAGDSGTTGILTDTGNLVLDPNSTFATTLNGTTAGTGYDQIVAGGSGSTINLMGATLSVTVGPSFPTGGGQQFTILHNTSGKAVTGTFAGLAEGATLTSGTHQFSISYKGGTDKQDVVLTALISTTTTVSPVTTTLVSGQSVTLTATVTPGSGTGTPTGTVDFKNGTTDLGTATLSGGKATLTTTKLTAGADSITASYSGDTTYGASTSLAQTVTVGQASTTTGLTVSPNPAVAGQPVTLTAVVSTVAPGTGTPTGTVTFFSGGTALGSPATLASGVAVLTTTSLPPGTSTITAQYSGDTNFTASTSGASSEVINQGNAIVLLSTSNTNPFALVPITLTAIVSAASGSGTPTGTVTFRAGNGTSLGTATLNLGAATLTTGTIPLGAQGITAVYSGDTNFTTATSAPLAVTIGHPTDLYVNQIYLDAFGVPADLGATYWIALLNNGYSPKMVARDILQSRGARSAAANFVFETLLGRPATSQELRRVSASGITSTTPLAIRIFGSQEFYVTQGHNTPTGWLTALAKDWFGAPFSPGKQARLLRQVDRGASRTRIARQQLTSPAGVAAQVNNIVESVLDRPATRKEQAQFAPLVSQGNLVTVYTDLFSSREFKALVKGQ